MKVDFFLSCERLTKIVSQLRSNLKEKKWANLKSNFFLNIREKERICGPDGFLDSKRYQRSFKTNRKPKDCDRTDQHISVVDLRQNQIRHSKEYDKRMKVIEVSDKAIEKHGYSSIYIKRKNTVLNSCSLSVHVIYCRIICGNTSKKNES